MNKVFVKTTSLVLGLTLATSVGAIFSSKKAQSVSASEALAYTLDGTITGGSSGYATESDISQGDLNWKVLGNTTQNPWRIGGNSLSGVDKTVYSTVALNNTITKVELSVGSASSITVNSLKLIVSSSSTFSPVVEEVSQTFAANSTITFEATEDWTDCYYKFVFNVTVSGTSNKFVQFKKADFFYESSIERGEVSIGNLNESLYFVGDTNSLNVVWDPLSSGATIKSHSFTSNDTDVLSFSGDTFTAAAPGKVKITLTAVDTNDEEYSVTTDNIYISNAYDFEVGDQVVLYSPSVTMELTSINTGGSTHYGVGTAYATEPNGTFLWNVEDGTVSGSLSFVNDGNYLGWTSGNSLTTKTTQSDNTSWYVVRYDDYSLIINAATTTREVWWNNGATSLRFACYEGKTPETSGYNAVDLMKIEEVPVRGTFAITSPTETLMKNGATGSLTYSWVPAEESSATIETIVWESSATDVISVSESSYEALGPGKAKISVTATDSNGQIYTDSTSDITVVDVVSGDYVKRTSVYDGDTVALVCEDAGTELSNIKSNIGEYVFYETKPASVFDFTLVLSGDYYYFKTSSEKYLTWGDSGKADIKLLDEPTDKSLWSISFDENDNTVIENKELDGETHRYLAWNTSSPRFAAYKTGQTAIQLYGPDTDIEVSYNGMQFINNLRDIICDATGQTAPSSSTWENLNIIYDRTGISEIPAEDKELFRTITAVEHDNPQTNRAKVEAAMAKYDYIVAKYNKTLGLVDEYPDFIGRDPAPLRSVQINNNQNNNINISVLAVVIVAVTSVSAIGVLLVVKKRKNHI